MHAFGNESVVHLVGFVQSRERRLDDLGVDI